MNVWIVNPYGTVPGEGWRDYRSYMLALALHARGHQVRWFLSDFVHRSKTYRQAGSHSMKPGLEVTALHASAYSSNISLDRIRYERSFGRSFAQASAELPKPDVVVLADPSLFYSAPVLRYCRSSGCKLVLDVIDLWPELFAVVLPKPLRRLQGAIFAPLYNRRRRLAAAADGVVAVTGDYLDTVCPATSHPAKPRQVAYWGVDLADFRNASSPAGLGRRMHGVRDDAALVVAYAGTLGDAYDMSLLEQAVEHVAASGKPVRFVVAGDGPKRERFEALAARLPGTLRFLGPVDARDLAAVYADCDVGLMSYVTGSTVSMPIKFYDYLAAGLAILNSLGREAGQFVERTEIGLNYVPQDLSSLMQGLEQLASQPAMLALCKANALQLAEEFDSRRQHDRFAAFVESVVASPA
ncbi:MAG: glycosyltransferase family 4 protein [Rubrivivax sp.]